jgi:hypothetical protein
MQINKIEQSVKQIDKTNKKAPQPLRLQRNVRLVETGENRTPRPWKAGPEYPTSLVGTLNLVCLSL